MSGGSFNYLCFAEVNELFNKRSDLADMVEALAHAGAKDAAMETQDILLILRHFEVLMQARVARLATVWKAVEWHQSGDWVQAQVDGALTEYRSPAQPMGEPQA